MNSWRWWWGLQKSTPRDCASVAISSKFSGFWKQQQHPKTEWSAFAVVLFFALAQYLTSLKAHHEFFIPMKKYRLSHLMTSQLGILGRSVLLHIGVSNLYYALLWPKQNWPSGDSPAQWKCSRFLTPGPGFESRRWRLVVIGLFSFWFFRLIFFLVKSEIRNQDFKITPSLFLSLFIQVCKRIRTSNH